MCNYIKHLCKREITMYYLGIRYSWYFHLDYSYFMNIFFGVCVNFCRSCEASSKSTSLFYKFISILIEDTFQGFHLK